MADRGCGTAKSHFGPRLQARGHRRLKLGALYFFGPAWPQGFPVCILPHARPQTLPFQQAVHVHQRSFCSSELWTVIAVLSCPHLDHLRFL